MLVVEIVIVSVSVIILLATAVVTARAALSFKKTFSVFQRHAEPKIIMLMNEGEIAQSRAFGVLDKLDILQRKIEAARMAIYKMLVLIMAIRDTMARISPWLQYVGL